jgi:hypothetical protein
MGKKTKKTRNRSKTTGKKNSLKARPTKPKRKAGRLSNKSKIAITVALIGLIGSVLPAIINMFGGSGLTGLSSEQQVTLNPPVVFPDAKLPDGRCIKEPKIEVVAESSHPLEEEAICARIGKPRWYKEEKTLPLVPRENFTVKKELGGKRLVGTLDSDAFIKEQYESTPHGLYRVEFEITNPSIKPEKASSEVEFNYIYKEDFRELDKVIDADFKNFKNIEGIDGGLEINNRSESGTFVSAKLKQDFDFKTDFYVSGFFTMEFENPRDPSGFDICLCDRWGEQLSVVFADGGLNAFSIKMRGEKFKGSGVLVRSNTTAIERTTADNTVYNYFKIRIWQDGRHSRCSLYVQSKGSDFRGVPPVHERIIDTSVFGEKCTRIMLKLWKAGILKLYNLEVAETPKKIS